MRLNIAGRVHENDRNQQCVGAVIPLFKFSVRHPLQNPLRHLVRCLIVSDVQIVQAKADIGTKLLELIGKLVVLEKLFGIQAKGGKDFSFPCKISLQGNAVVFKNI